MNIQNKIMIFGMALFLFVFSGIKLNSQSKQSQKLNPIEKIDYLIQKIEKSNLMFIRGGSEYSSKDAAKHLNMKWKNAGKKRINTPQKFIKFIASKSSLLGTPYYIKYPDGKKIKSKTWLQMQLNEISTSN